MELNYIGSGKIFFQSKEYDCHLYINEKQGGILIKIDISCICVNFLELPIELSYISGRLNNGFCFTLHTCFRTKTEDFISRKKSVLSYTAKYMFKGILSESENNYSFNKIIFELSNIIEWGGLSGYSIGTGYELKVSNVTEKMLYQNNDFEIKYFVQSSMLPWSESNLLKENIILKQNGNIEITFKNEKTIDDFELIFTKIKRLIELSTLKNISLTKMIGMSKNYKQSIDDYEIESPIDIISYKFTEVINNKKERPISYGWIQLEELINNDSFRNYFNKYDVLEPIVELYIEIIESQDMSPVRKFLNLTQALETYHARFKANTLSEFKHRIDEVILKNRPTAFQSSDRAYLLNSSQKSVSLESRLMDLLLADFEIYFSTGDIKRFEFPRVIAKTRNYYTHYNEALKNNERILTKEELDIYNTVLLYILEYYLLKELGFSDMYKIKQKLNKRWGDISTLFDLKKASQKKFENIQKNIDENESVE